VVVLLAYKRYINKKGKRHGPYYYKNVRDQSGNVKSIYLGKVTSRGKRPLEVVIFFMIILLIIMSALFFIQNRSIVLSRVSAEDAAVPFEIDQILIKVLIKENEYIEKDIRVMNIGSEEVTIDIDTSGISDIVDVLSKGFIIKPGQTKIVRLNFSSFDSIQGIEQAPGVYIGKILARTDTYETTIPVIIEIESKNVLFDMNLNPVARDRSILQGSSTTFEIRVFNLQSIDSFNVNMEFFVKDTNGNTIISESESVVVKTQASFFKTLKIPENLKTGDYIFVSKASLGDSVGTASYLFDVIEVEREKKAASFIGFCRNDPLCWLLSIIILLLLFTIGAYAYFFIGAFIYKKLFGVRAPKTKEAEEVEKAPKESSIARFFRESRERRIRAKEEGIKRKFELQGRKEKIRLEEEKLREENIKIKLERQKHKELEERKQKDLEEKRISNEKVKRIKLREEKREGRQKKVFDFFHGLGLVKTEEEKKEIAKRRQEEGELKERERRRRVKEKREGKLEVARQRELEREEKRRKKELEIKRKSEEKREEELEEKSKEEEDAKNAKLREQKEKVRREKVFDFFHGLGLVKTEKEKRDAKKQKLESLEKREKLIKQRIREREKEQEIKWKLREKKKEEEERGKGLVGKYRRIIDKGYRALDKNNVDEADNIYMKLMDDYKVLPSKTREDVFKEINSFYTSLLLKKQQLKEHETEEKKKELKKKEEEEQEKILFPF